VLTDNDKALVERLRWSASGKVGAEQARLERNAADRIEALTAENERLREALGWYAEDNHWRYIPAAGCTCVDADGGDIARAALGEAE